MITKIMFTILMCIKIFDPFKFKLKILNHHVNVLVFSRSHQFVLPVTLYKVWSQGELRETTLSFSLASLQDSSFQIYEHCDNIGCDFSSKFVIYDNNRL